MCKARKYVEARVIEAEMQESRIKEDFIGKVEEISIKQMVENAKVNNRLCDKIIITINPMYVHIPERQRNRREERRCRSRSCHMESRKWSRAEVLGFDDAQEELKRLEDLQNARKELERTQGEKPVSQKMFKAV